MLTSKPAPETALRVIVTRPAAQAQPWLEALGQRGLAAAALPLIDIVPAPQPQALAQAAAALASRALVVFVSTNAVEALFEVLDGPWPDATLAAAPGPGTARALRERGVPAAQVTEPAADAPQFDSEALWLRLAGHDWRGRRVLVLRGNGGREWLADRLRDAGAEVELLCAYERRPPTWDAVRSALLERALLEPEHHVWLFSSSEAVRHLGAHRGSGWQASRALATHPRIAQAARALGFGRVDEVRPDAASIAALLRTPLLQSPPS